MLVSLAAGFRARLEQIEAFFEPAGEPQVFDQLLDDLENIVIPDLSRFPGLGRLYLDAPPQSTEALMAVARLPRDADQLLRKYVHDDFVILYAALPDALHLISIRHYLESAFHP
jgi:hypothetical protein